jgi:hypothetical protein
MAVHKQDKIIFCSISAHNRGSSAVPLTMPSRNSVIAIIWNALILQDSNVNYNKNIGTRFI